MTPPSLPPLDEALRALLRRQVRAVVWLLVRMLLLAMLTAWLVLLSPWLRQNRWLLDTPSGLLVLWPFVTAVGRNWLWRIALGRAYCQAGRFADAERTLRPLDGLQGRLFDAQGDGARALAEARSRLPEATP